MSMFTAMSRRGALALIASLAIAGSVAGCSGNTAAQGSAEAAGSSSTQSAEKVELQIFAANSLEKALPEVQALYTEQTGVTFADTQFKASGDLVEQMRAGAQVDALITASKGTMDDAVEADLVDESTREDMFVNDLVIVKAEGSDLAISSIEDVASLDGRIAIGDAATVPAGKYANQALASVGLYTNAEGVDGERLPTRWAPPPSTSLRATARPALSTAPISSATMASKRRLSARRIPISPSCTPAPCPLLARMPRKQPSSWSSALPIRMRRRFGPSTVLSSLNRCAAQRGKEVAR